jgi:hypothetical protein
VLGQSRRALTVDGLSQKPAEVGENLICCSISCGRNVGETKEAMHKSWLSPMLNKHSRVFQSSDEGFAFVSQRIVFGSDEHRRGQSLERSMQGTDRGIISPGRDRNPLLNEPGKVDPIETPPAALLDDAGMAEGHIRIRVDKKKGRPREVSPDELNGGEKGNRAASAVSREPDAIFVGAAKFWKMLARPRDRRDGVLHGGWPRMLGSAPVIHCENRNIRSER